MSVIRDLRDSADLTQAELAQLAGTSQPTIAAYEAGRKSPTLRTLQRLARAAGREAVISFVPAMTREDRRSLLLHRAIARELTQLPGETLSRTSRNIRLMMELHEAARPLLDEWVRILERPVDEIVAIMTDPGLHGRDLRQVTPFAGVLTRSERTRVYANFARSEVQS